MADNKIDETKDKEFSKRQTQLIALTALILAICATFASLYAGANASKGILAQSQASDGWAYYQAKSIKQSMYKMQLEALDIDPPSNLDPTRLNILREKYQQTIDRYENEQLEIRKQANQKEADRDHFLDLNRSFAGSLTYLQIAILLTSHAGLMKQIGFWYAGITIGAFGVYNFVAAMMMV
ncbi:MAG: DUF4337 domain-containing protein [Selenomonadaceae bacterium]|nr:DUF4337 domain-containing protein [Selenomonadaceae bacterium]